MATAKTTVFRLDFVWSSEEKMVSLASRRQRSRLIGRDRVGLTARTRLTIAEEEIHEKHESENQLQRKIINMISISMLLYEEQWVMQV